MMISNLLGKITATMKSKHVYPGEKYWLIHLSSSHASPVISIRELERFAYAKSVQREPKEQPGDTR